jgi:hypothetical protein
MRIYSHRGNSWASQVVQGGSHSFKPFHVPPTLITGTTSTISMPIGVSFPPLGSEPGASSRQLNTCSLRSFSHAHSFGPYLCVWLPNYHGNNDFIKSVYAQQLMHHPRLAWECPFSFYDEDGDGFIRNDDALKRPASLRNLLNKLHHISRRHFMNRPIPLPLL